MRAHTREDVHATKCLRPAPSLTASVSLLELPAARPCQRVRKSPRLGWQTRPLCLGSRRRPCPMPLKGSSEVALLFQYSGRLLLLPLCFLFTILNCLNITRFLRILSVAFPEFPVVFSNFACALFVPLRGRDIETSRHLILSRTAYFDFPSTTPNLFISSFRFTFLHSHPVLRRHVRRRRRRRRHFRRCRLPAGPASPLLRQTPHSHHISSQPLASTTLILSFSSLPPPSPLYPPDGISPSFACDLLDSPLAKWRV